MKLTNNQKSIIETFVAKEQLRVDINDDSFILQAMSDYSIYVTKEENGKFQAYQIEYDKDFTLTQILKLAAKEVR